MSWLGSIGGRLYRGEVSFDFVGRQKLWYKISAAILLISIGALIFRGLSYSVEFKGGDVYKFTAASTVHPTQTQVANTVTAAGGGSTLTVQQVGGSGWSVQTPSLDKTERFNVQDALATRFLGGHKDEVSLSSVGPSWGSQISHKALEALIAFLIVIVLYLSVAFEWRMASAALVALLHDIVITVGVYALFGLQVSPATVIGLLTILGYSLYDTVVVFDKVRENTAGLLATRRTTYSEAANLALNQTLVRSINTSLIALLPVAAILAVGVGLLGAGELKDLALVLFVGMLSGTYSSICIATPVLADLKEREPQYQALAKRVALRAAGGRAALRAKAKAAKSAPGGGTSAGEAAAGAADAEAGREPARGAADDQSAAPPGEPVPAGRPATAGAAPRGPGARSGPRQQPRRSSAAKRRPGGKKKRR